MDIELEKEIAKRFEILRFLGGGYVNNVYLVKDRETPEADACVLKCPKKEFLNHSDVRWSLENEGKLLCVMNQRNIVKGLEYGVCGKSPYLLTGYIKGKHLKRNNWYKETDNSFIVLYLILQILDALVYFTKAFENECEDGTVVHGDLGLHNLLISNHLEISIIDFEKGQLYYKDEQENLMDRSNQVPAEMMYGHTAFSPPEALLKKDPLVDIYSAGAIIFSLLTGKNLRQFRKDPTVTGRIVITEPSNIDVLPLSARVSFKLMKIAERATAFDRGKRYQSAREFQTELNKITQICQQQMHAAVKRRVAPQATN